MEKETSTTEIMEFLQEHMATKEDLEACATKDDLKAFATKDDLQRSQNKQKQEILDAVDNKLADLKGDLIVLMRKEDAKVVKLVNVLKDKNLLNKEEVESILELEPFPQAS